MLLIDFIAQFSEIHNTMQKALDQVQDLGTKACTELQCSANDPETLNLTKTIQESIEDVLSTLDSDVRAIMLDLVLGTVEVEVPMTLSQPPPLHLTCLIVLGRC
jgi:hypothetical protein